MQPTLRTPVLLTLVAGDVLLFLLFTALGRVEHRLELTWAGILGTALPFIVAWFGVSLLTGALSAGSLRSPLEAAKRATLTWLVAGPLGVVLRALLLGFPVSIPFAAVTWGFVWVMLLIWRPLFAYGLRRIDERPS